MLGGFVLNVFGFHAGPVGHVATHGGGHCGGGEHAEAFAGAHAEALLADVGAPGNGVAVGNGVVEDLHHFVEGDVVALGVAPVVLDFEGELLIEGVMGVGGEAYVVVGVEAEALVEAFGGVLFAVVGEFLGHLSQIDSVGGADGFDAKELAVFVGLEFFEFVALGDGGHHGIGDGAELGVVGEGVAVFNTGTHLGFGHEAEGLHAVDDIVEGAALAEADVAAGADGGHGAVVVGVFDDVHFAEVVGAFVHAEQFGFDECTEVTGSSFTMVNL